MSKRSSTRTTITITRMPMGSYHTSPVKTVEAYETATHYTVPSMTPHTGTRGGALCISKKTGREVGGDKYYSWRILGS